MTDPLRDVNANLLVTLHALLEDPNLTRVGERLRMSPSAVSSALTRLRLHFDDPLLQRAGRGFDLTPLATRIRPAIADAVGAAEGLLGSSRDFDPATSRRRFTISMSEYAMTVVAEPLARLFTEQAPGCALALDPVVVGPEEVETHLLRRDLVIAPVDFAFAGRVQPVFTDRLVCLVSRDHPRLRDGALSIEDLAAMPHAAVDVAPAARPRPLDIELAAREVESRAVLIRVTSILTLPFAISGTDMCAFVPLRLARRCLRSLDLTIARTPLASVEITEAAHQHPRRTDDSAAAWLRRILHEVAVDVEDDTE